MSATAKNVIFVSHASNDEGIGQALVDNLFNRSSLKSAGYELFFTSDKTLTERMAAGTDLWPTILEKLSCTRFFIALLSQDFFRSEWCVSELALFQDMVAREKLRARSEGDAPKLPDPWLLLIDEDCREIAAHSPLAQIGLRLGVKLVDLRRLLKHLTNKQRIPCKKGVNQWTLKSAIDKRIEERDQSSSGHFFDIARQHFASGRTSNYPITFVVRKDEYIQTAVNMARAATDKLVWTVLRSPLLVAEAYRRQGLKMSYDRKFEDLEARRRIRLVIFQTAAEASAYHNIDTAWHNEQLKAVGMRLNRRQLAKRKAAFEDSARAHGGELLFTRVDLLPKCSLAATPPSYNDMSPLEFAWGDCGEGSTSFLLMETGFCSAFNLKHGLGVDDPQRLGFGHLTFYKLLDRDAEERITSNAVYKELYGHLRELWQIAMTVCGASPPPEIFFKRDKLVKLCG